MQVFKISHVSDSGVSNIFVEASSKDDAIFRFETILGIHSNNIVSIEKR